MKLDEIPARRYGVNAARMIVECRCCDQADRNLFVRLILGRGQFDRNVGLLKSGNLVVIGKFGIGFVSGTVDQMQVQAVLAFGNENSFMRQRNAWIGGIGDIRQKNALPDRRALRGVHVLHVEHDLREPFVEDPGLDFKRNLRAFELILEMSQRSQRPRCEIESVDQRQQPCADDEDRQHAAKAPHAQAAGAHRSDFTVGGETAQANKNPHQHAHRDGISERQWHGVEENFSHAGQRRAGADYEFKNASQVAREEHEGKDRRADEGV